MTVTLWLDAQLSPGLAAWIERDLGLSAYPVRALGLRDADDRVIFDAARRAGAIVLTKDRDFVDLLRRFGSPPKVLLVTCGNTSNERMRAVLSATLVAALRLLEQGEELIELTDQVRR